MHLPRRRRLQTIIMIVSLFFSFFSMQRQVPEVPSCAASTVTRKLHRFLRLHLNPFRGQGRGFCDEEQNASPQHQSIIFSSIPSRIPRNNERNRRRFRRRATSPFVLCSYQTVYCVSTIYTRRKLCFILNNSLERKKVEKNAEKCSSQLKTKRGISERHQNPFPTALSVFPPPQKKEASLSYFIILFARINTHHTYTLRSGEQPRIKKKSPREEDICVHK